MYLADIGCTAAVHTSSGSAYLMLLFIGHCHHSKDQVHKVKRTDEDDHHEENYVNLSISTKSLQCIIYSLDPWKGSRICWKFRFPRQEARLVVLLSARSQFMYYVKVILLYHVQWIATGSLDVRLKNET